MKYILVQWPESQLLMDHKDFNKCLLVQDIEGHEEVGSSAYMCPEDLYDEIFGFKDGDILISSAGCPFIYNGKVIEDGYNAYIGIDLYKNIKTNIPGRWTIKKGVRRASKEEEAVFLNTLSKKGYIWDRISKTIKYERT